MMTEKEAKQVALYADAIATGIKNEFDERGIYFQEMSEDEATLFLHTLANIAPARMYERLTRQKIDLLAFNHIANRLVFQFSDKPE